MLNDMTVKHAYPIRLTDERFDSLDEVCIFSTLDANYGYWKINIDDWNKVRTTFTSPHGLYRCLRMPFSLESAPSKLQGAMDTILSALNAQFALVCPDDVVIFLRSVNRRLDQLQSVLRLVSRAAITLTLNKCFFFEDCIGYLGHISHSWRLSISIGATDEIHGLQHCTKMTEIKSFFCLSPAFRQFVPSFASLAVLLDHKPETDQPYHLR